VSRPSLSLIEFPADDPERARRFWSGFLEVDLELRGEGEGEGWQTRPQDLALASPEDQTLAPPRDLALAPPRDLALAPPRDLAATPAVGVHVRGRGPGDSFSLPYFAVSDIAETLERVLALGGSVVHPGEQWAICKDSEGSPFAVAREPL
jgi:predicted enzyme related to lactoylglutathione lyase